MTVTGSTPITVPADATSIEVSLGDLYDADGNIVTGDSVASLVGVTSSDATLCADGVVSGVTATAETTGEAGTFTVEVVAVTAAGVQVTGVSEPITTEAAAPPVGPTVGPPVTVAVNVTVPTSDAPPAPVPDEEPPAPA